MNLAATPHRARVHFAWAAVSLPRWAVRSFVIGLNLLYLLVAVHTPIAVWPGAPIDDTLFMTLGQSLAEGHWLGPYSETTLVKGPGYPAFLALNAWLGLPLTVSTALLHCGAITFFAAVCRRFIRCDLLSGLLFALLLWHPISLHSDLLRVYRETIYYAEALLFLAAAIAALFDAREPRQHLACSALAGFALGWLWLTREEGIWILPGLAILVVGAAWQALGTRRMRQLVWPLLAATLTFGAMQAGFRAVNWWVYGSFVGVDFNERNYQRALRALHSVRSGGVAASISITREARQHVYPVSPSFASLKPYFEGTPGTAWAQLSCAIMQTFCDEMATGYFIFALRQAAAQKGYYASPAKASEFFGSMADEIEAACARGQLQCGHQLIAAFPPWGVRQALAALPEHLRAAVNILLFLNPGQTINPSGDNSAILGTRLRFLNYPLHTSPTDAQRTSYSFSGWYYHGGSNWFAASVRQPDGSTAEVRVRRLGSWDLQGGFNDPAASQQRFVMQTRCTDDCVLQMQTPQGVKVERKLGEIRGPYGFTAEGFGQFNIDEAIVSPEAAYVQYRFEAMFARIRGFVMSSYQYLFLPILALGVLAFAAASLLRLRQAVSNTCYVLALVSFVLVASRLGLLIIVGVTSTVNTTVMVNSYYGAPVFFHLVSAAILSIAAALQVFGRQAKDAARPPTAGAAL